MKYYPPWVEFKSRFVAKIAFSSREISHRLNVRRGLLRNDERFQVMPDFVVQSTMQVYRASLIPTLLLFCLVPVWGTEIGWISPTGNMNVLAHRPFVVTCTMNRGNLLTRNYSSTDLWFYTNDEPVPAESIKIVNDTSIELHVQNAIAGSYKFVCKMNESTGIGMKSINVGYKPQKVLNFKCHSHNWQRMNCSFEQAYNPIATSYMLKFGFENSPGDFQCPLENKYNHKWECSRDMDNSYRQSQEIYNFELEAINVLGNSTERFVINHYDNVIPEAPSECMASNITSRSAFLHWSISYKLQTFKRDFVFQIKIVSSFDNKNWKPVDVSRVSRKLTNYSLPIDSLEYADTRYDVRIRMKTATSEDTEEMWSNYSSCLFNTLPRRPDNPPEVAIGGFEINAYNDVFVYWKEIPKSKHNSATGFQYKPDIKRNELSTSPAPVVGRNGSTMIQYKNMTDGNYTFIILSSNSEGDSFKSSKLFIPSKEYRIAKPEIIKLLADSGKYTLSWKAAPKHNARITSYTVFWCNSSSNSPNDCNGSINFDYVDGDQQNYELNNVSSTLNFAVAANVGELSSGMVWASCTATQKNDIGKLKTIWIPAMQSTYIDLEWKLECGDSAIVEGYSIIYCPINNLPREQTCKGNETTHNITGQTSYRIEGLKPYVTYKIQIAMFSKSRIGPRSDPLFNTTLEAAPSEPRDLVFSEVRNDSVALHWKPPLHINGGKMNYEVWYNKSKIKVYTENYTSDQTYILRGLEPFMNYKIIVLAFTIGQSNASNSVDILTEIGTPGEIQQPGSEDSSDSKLSIVWQPPERRAGCLEYYELKVKTNTNSDDAAAITRIQGTRCQLKRSICQLAGADSHRVDKYEFSVRAVNVILSPHAPNYTVWNKLSCDKKYSYYSDQIVQTLNSYNTASDDIECELDDDEIANIDWTKIDKFATLLYGEWSRPLAHWCNNYGSENTKAIVFLTIIACSGIISLIICTYLSYKKMKQIKNIKVVLPDALNDIVISEKGDVCKENGSYYGHDNYGEFAGKIQDDSHVPFTNSNRHSEKNINMLDDTASLSSAEDHLDNGVIGANEADLLSLSDDFKSQYSLPMDNTECVPEQTIIPKATVGLPSSMKVESMMSFSPSGYVQAPVAKPSANGYVQAPIAKPPASNYIQPHMFTGNAGLAKTPIVTSTDERGISGYVTHKQLSDFGHRM